MSLILLIDRYVVCGWWTPPPPLSPHPLSHPNSIWLQNLEGCYLSLCVLAMCWFQFIDLVIRVIVLIIKRDGWSNIHSSGEYEFHFLQWSHRWREETSNHWSNPGRVRCFGVKCKVVSVSPASWSFPMTVQGPDYLHLCPVVFPSGPLVCSLWAQILWFWTRFL